MFKKLNYSKFMHIYYTIEDSYITVLHIVHNLSVVNNEFCREKSEFPDSKDLLPFRKLNLSHKFNFFFLIQRFLMKKITSIIHALKISNIMNYLRLGVFGLL